MKIGTSTLYDNAARWMSDLSSRASAVSTQISSAHRIQRPSDDPLASAQLAALKRTGAEETQYAGNLTLAASLLQQSDDALGSISTDLQRAQELALRASNGTLSDGDRRSIASELDGIVDAMMSTANSTDSRGVPLFAGADGATPYSRNADGAVGYAGIGDPPALPVSGTSTVAATESGQRALGGITGADGSKTDVFAIVKSLADALRAGGGSAAVAASIADLGSAAEQVTNVRASIDARASRVALESSQLDARAANRETERSSLEDTDVPAAYVKLQQFSTQLAATQASFTKLSGLSLFNYMS